MARKNLGKNEEKARLLRALAFEIHRKRPAEEALRAHLDDQMRAGRRREFRAAEERLEADGFAAALNTLELLGEDAAALLDAVVETGDHRVQSAALTALADFLERAG